MDGAPLVMCHHRTKGGLCPSGRHARLRGRAQVQVPRTGERLPLELAHDTDDDDVFTLHVPTTADLADVHFVVDNMEALKAFTDVFSRKICSTKHIMAAQVGPPCHPLSRAACALRALHCSAPPPPPIKPLDTRCTSWYPSSFYATTPPPGAHRA